MAEGVVATMMRWFSRWLKGCRLRTMEELVALEGVDVAHVIGAFVVGAGVANGWSCSSHR